MKLAKLIFLTTISCLLPTLLFASGLLHQDISVRLLPELHQLQASIIVTRETENTLWPKEYTLAPQAKVSNVKVDGKTIAYELSTGVLSLLIEEQAKELSFSYKIRFDDPVPQDIVGIEDPSYGVVGTIMPDGTYLSAASGWHPQVQGYDCQYKVTIVGKGQLTGVTNGRMVDYNFSDNITKVVWETTIPQSSLTLAAGHYRLHQKQLDRVQVLAFMTDENTALASGYLDSITEYLLLYQSIFGPYPYDKFAIVENFYPTGYGLPGWTLIGKRVIRLPFIRTTSLPHEIAHAWWGNAVEVEYNEGNWAEGLATYVADYYLKELADPGEAKEYRRKLLRDYAALVGDDSDMSLLDFRSRKSKRDQAIGYGKAAMVFHMLRERLGDDAFWSALRSVARSGTGKKYGWDDLKGHFEAAAGEDLGAFFNQWLSRTGAPELGISDVDVIKGGTQWQVSGNVVQKKPVYDLAIPLVLETENRSYTQVVGLYQNSDCFVFTVNDRPLRLSLDPESHLFRMLYDQELPATINDLRASTSKLVVVADGADNLLGASQDLIKGLHWQDARAISEADYLDMKPVGRDILVLGWPNSEALQPEIPETSVSEERTFQLPDKTIDKNKVFFMVTRTDDGQRVISHFLPGSLSSARDTARRVHHYGRYSYLIFTAGRNRLKGTWEASESPLKMSLDMDRQNE